MPLDIGRDLQSEMGTQTGALFVSASPFPARVLFSEDGEALYDENGAFLVAEEEA